MLLMNAEFAPDPKVSKLYKPLSVRLGGITWLNPFRIFLLFAVTTCSISFALEANFGTPLHFSYTLGVCAYLTELHKRLLDKLQPVLTLDSAQFEEERYRLDHYPRYQFIGAVCLGLPIMILVNWSNTELQGVLDGNQPSAAFLWKALIAALNWIVVLQVLVIATSNTLRFCSLARKHTRVELMDIDSLAPFTNMGVSTILLFVGGYTILPLAIIINIDLLGPTILVLLVTLPIAIVLMLLPIESIRLKIRTKKDKEIELITRGIQGDVTAIHQTKLAKEADTVSTSNLILYRDVVQNVSERPFNNSHLRRLIVYIIIPICAWLASSLSEHLLESTL